MITYCISTHNNLNYLKLAVYSVRKYAFFKAAPFIIHAENCTDGTDEWLKDNSARFNLDIYIEKNKKPRGIGGGMNFCADLVKTKYIIFLHSDFFVSRNWDLHCYTEIQKYKNERAWISSLEIQPNIFNEKQNERLSKLIVERNMFGEYYHNFDEKYFIEYAKQFSEKNSAFRYNIASGVNGIVKKSDWDYVGGNDDIFAPASYDDIDLFLRMQLEGFKMHTVGSSVVYHFGARGSHFPLDDFNKSAERQLTSEKNNVQRFIEKWEELPWIHIYSGYRVTETLQQRYKILKTINKAKRY